MDKNVGFDKHSIEGKLKYNTGIAMWLYYHGFEFDVTREWADSHRKYFTYYLFLDCEDVLNMVGKYYQEENDNVNMRSYDRAYKGFKKETNYKLEKANLK